MKRYILDMPTKVRLNAHARLNGLSTHYLSVFRSKDRFPFTLITERGEFATEFTILLGHRRHSVTLPHDDRTLVCRLLTAIDEIVASHNSDLEYGEGLCGKWPAAVYVNADLAKRLEVLVVEGGLLELNLDIPSSDSFYVALHRNKSGSGVIAILCLHRHQPKTKSLTLYGTNDVILQHLVNSIEHLAGKPDYPAWAA